MTTIITLRCWYSGFANVPNGWCVHDGSHSGDARVRDMRVLLPVGYTVAPDSGGLLAIYDAAGKRCDIIGDRLPRRDEPCLLVGPRTIKLTVLETSVDGVNWKKVRP